MAPCLYLSRAFFTQQKQMVSTNPKKFNKKNQTDPNTALHGLTAPACPRSLTSTAHLRHCLPCSQVYAILL